MLFEWASGLDDKRVFQGVILSFGTKKVVLHYLNGFLPELVANSKKLINKQKLTSMDKNKIKGIFELVSLYLDIAQEKED